ncbi:12316_t:CDS:2, partial [Cetraspora pellucida]
MWKVQELLREYHMFYSIYKQAHEILLQNQRNQQRIDLKVYLHFNKQTDQRRYNLSTANEIAIILLGNPSIPETMQLGWHPDLHHTPINMQGQSPKNQSNILRLTQLEFYTFRLFPRHNEFSTILHGGKLFQEFIVNTWAVTEQNRLRFLCMNQNTLRADLYQGLTDIVGNNSNEELFLNNLGHRIIFPSTHTGNEIKQYIDARYIGTAEAAWRHFGMSLHEEVPNVVRLALHLPGMHTIVFDPTDDVSTILSQFLQHFVWNKKIKQWTSRKQGFVIGRLYFTSPSAGERFYLQLLLTSIRGPTSFKHLRTINNIVHPTFKSACIALGLLENDQEWFQCLEEAAILHTRSQLRVLFAIILIQFFDFGLFLLDKILRQSNQSLDMFPPMPLWRQNWGHHNRSHIIAEQLAWDYQKLQDIINECVPLLNPEQAAAYHIIVDSVIKQDGQLFFLNGHAGTGKTF